MFSSLPNRGRIFFKNAAGTVLTSSPAFWGPLTSTYAGVEVESSDVKNTSLFICPGFSQRRLVTKIVQQSHYVWVDASESYLITGLKDFGSHTEIVGLRQSTPMAFAASAAAGIVSEWAFESSAALLTDAQGLNSLTNVNTVTYSSDKPSEVPFAIGSASFVAASSQRLKITDAAQSSLDIAGNFTICCRLKFTSLPGTAFNFLAKGAGAGDRGYICYFDASRVLGIETSVDGTVQITALGATLLAIDIWYSFAAVFDGTDVRVYLNGALDSNGTSNPRAKTSGLYNNAQDFCLGGRSDATLFLNGKLAHVLICNQAKTAAQIAAWHSTDILE